MKWEESRRNLRLAGEGGRDMIVRVLDERGE